MTGSAWKVSSVEWGTFALDGGAMFGIIPRPLWSKLIPPDERNAIPMALRSMCVSGFGRHVLVDAGIWEGFSPKLATRIYAIRQADFARALGEQAGLGLSDITDVIATHLHFDHIGGFFGLADGKVLPRFPAAALHVQKAQLEWGLNPSAKDRGSYVPELVAAVAAHPRLVVHDGPWSLAPGLDVTLSYGHTRAMQIVTVAAGDTVYVHTADMVPTSAHVAVPYIMGYDNEPVSTASEKERLYAAHPDAVYFFQHDPEAAMWTIEVTPEGARRKAPFRPE
jgi:glyoxylase-like metal-dependent hydrolase (beta-lactamase superfamily II)